MCRPVSVRPAARRPGALSLLRALGIGLLVTWLGGCGGSPPVIKYYTAELPAAPDAVRTAYPVMLLVGRVTAPMILRDDRIMYRTGANEMGAYEYHRWAEPPALMLEVSLLRLLRQSGRYASVEEASSKVTGLFVVHGRLSDFEEVDASAVTARVTMEFELDDRKAGRTVWSHFYSHDEPVASDEIPDVVAALNRNLERGLEEVVAGLAGYWDKNPPQ